jgi:leader peptidase (prepilin peptidase)/N-methyltransferase
MPNWLLPLLLAPCIGSFAGVLIYRLPRGEPVLLDRSQCKACGHILGAPELVPLASFTLLSGHCRWCDARIPLVHTAVELACLGIAIWAVLAVPNTLLLWLTCGLGWTLLTLAWIDWEHMLLPDALTLPLLAAGLGATWLLTPAAVPWHAAAAATGYLGFRAVEFGYRLLRDRDGLGEGDAKLLAAAGAWIGPAPLPTVVFVAALCSLAMIVAQSLAGRRLEAGAAIPFGPTICLAIWLVWMGFDLVAVFVGDITIYG